MPCVRQASNVAGADDVGAEVAVVAAPRTGLGGVVEHRIHAGGSMAHGVGVGKIATNLADAQCGQRWSSRCG